jgi:hypothetical protein
MLESQAEVLVLVIRAEGGYCRFLGRTDMIKRSLN